MGKVFAKEMFRTLVLLILALTVISDGRQVRRKRQPPIKPDSLHCRDGTERVCECSDGSLADLTKNPCPGDSRPDFDSCKCLDGYETVSVPGRSHGYHTLCTKDGLTEKPQCKCSDPDASWADWSQHSCSHGHVVKCMCKK